MPTISFYWLRSLSHYLRENHLIKHDLFFIRSGIDVSTNEWSHSVMISTLFILVEAKKYISSSRIFKHRLKLNFIQINSFLIKQLKIFGPAAVQNGTLAQVFHDAGIHDVHLYIDNIRHENIDCND